MHLAITNQTYSKWKNKLQINWYEFKTYVEDCKKNTDFKHTTEQQLSRLVLAVIILECV